MSYPIQMTDLPHNCLARARQSYSIPFTFTVPDKLLPYACNHSTKRGSTVRKTHLLLPPSLGTSQTNRMFVDDITSDRAKVAYSIQVQVRKRLPNAGSITLRKACPVCIIPFRDEEPPMLIHDNDNYFRLSHGKSVSKGFPGICRSVGHLTAHMAELSSLCLSRENERPGNLPTFKVPVELHFQPTCHAELPPILHSVNIKLRCFTFFGALPYKIIPRPGDYYGDRAEYSYYMSTTRLGNRILQDVKWAKRQTKAISKEEEPMQDQQQSEEVAPSGRSAFVTGNDDFGICYATSLQIPMQLPRSSSKSSRRKLLTPTFSSCLLSRAYSLELKIFYQAACDGSVKSPKDVTTTSPVMKFLTPRSHLVLKAPLQIRVGNDGSSGSEDEGRSGKTLDDLILEEQLPPQYTRTCLSC